MGMVGGGKDAFIGAVHRMASGLDGLVELTAGAFSSDPERALASGRELLLSDERCYPSWREMLDAEAQLPADRRIDFVAIVTPNDLHHPVAMAALERGFHVICDKPMTLDVAEAEALAQKVEESGLVFCLTHNYTGYPMVKEARHRIAAGELGVLRKVVVEYPQGWLATRLEADGQKQASWRTDPARAGASCCIGDIGTHCENLAEYITGLRIASLCADLSTFVGDRPLDDDGSVLLRFAGGARGILYASQISIDEENALRIRVYGERGGLEWSQEEPNTLILKWPDRPREIQRTAGPTVSAIAAYNTRLPAGHPEGFLEAFANLYRNFATTLLHRLEGSEPPTEALDFPTVEDGLRGMRFIEAVVRSSRSDDKWVELEAP
jgi:predicted dehydrogenase